MTAHTGEAPLAYRRQWPTPFDPAPDLLHLRTAAPISRQRAPDGSPVWLITRFDDAMQVLSDRRFSTALTPRTLIRPKATGEAAIASPARQPGSFLGYDPPEHTRLRRMVARVFTPRRTRELSPRIEEIVTDLLDTMERNGPPADLIPAFAVQVPSLVICELLGVPENDQAEFQQLAFHAFDQTLARDELITSFTAMWNYIHGLVLAHRQQPDDTVLGALVRDHGHELTDSELTGIGNLLLLAGHDTTANMLGLGTLLLLRHPGQLAAVRDDPATVPDAIEEMLRYLSVAQTGLVRTATEDILINGHLIKTGEHVMMSLSTANRDPAYFQDPDRFDITRHVEQHLAFGNGIHHCMGAHLARQEMRVAFPALLQRFPGLRLAIPFEKILFRPFATVYGIEALPVSW